MQRAMPVEPLSHRRNFKYFAHVFTFYCFRKKDLQVPILSETIDLHPSIWKMSEKTAYISVEIHEKF
jgi:hypothetical protein